jgi:integrase/recombinase XerD
MATLNLVLDKRRARKDGTYPIVFRVRVEDKFCDIGTGFKVLITQYDLKNNCLLNDINSNLQLDQLKAHYLKRLRAYTVENVGCIDLKSIKSFLINKMTSEFTIIEFWKMHIEELTVSSRHGGARVYNTSLSVISKVIDLDIPFAKLNFKTILELETNLYKRGMSTNGIGVYMRSFRAICNKAINFDVVGYEWYPFRKYKIKKTKTTPRILSIREMKNYFSLDLSPSHFLYKSWLIGKLIFMLRGINIKDLLLLSSDNIKSGRIIYKRAKTGKIYSVKVTGEVAEVFKQFISNNTLLGILSNTDLLDKEKLVDIHDQKRKVINSHLSKIGKILEVNEVISTYVFRYSFANISKQLGYSKDLIAEALGHEYGNSVTGIYLEQYDNDLIDEMNLKVIDAVI